MSDEELTDQQADNLRAAYQQLCTSYHAIDDFRAKLLGFLPLATGTGIFLLLGNLKDGQHFTAETKSFLVAAGAFGFSITLGLFFYEIYGIKKCHALIQAGQRMEDSLHLDGQFKKRPQNVLYLINEPFAAGIIYPTVLAAWMFLALVFALPQTALLIAILVFIAGFVCSLIYNLQLRKGR